MSNDTLQQRIAAIKTHSSLENEMGRRGIALRPCGGSRGNTDRLEGCCPFHDDTTPSLSVYPETQQFHCFGCGAHGDVLDFIQRIAGVNLIDALQELEQGQAFPAPIPQRTISAIARLPTPHPQKNMLSQQRSHAQADNQAASIENHTPILSAALAIYQQVLSQHQGALSYLASRGISVEAIRRLALGYCDGRALRQALSGHAESWHAAQRAGLLTRSGKEWLSGRIVIPEAHRTESLTYTCTWMIGRLLPHQPSHMFIVRREQRYLGIMLPKPLLGYASALEQIQKDWPGQHPQGILVVEGAFDYVIARQWALPAIPVALLATHPSRSQHAQLLHLHALSGLPILDWHDADERGWQGALYMQQLLHGYPIKMMPEIAGIKDLADLAVHADGSTLLAQVWQKMLDGGQA